MPNAFKIGPFEASTNEVTSTIVISRGTDKLAINPANGAKAKEAVKMASSMFTVKAMPEFVAFSPFKLHFMADGGTRLETPDGGVAFGVEDYEDLIKIIDISVIACADSLRLRGGARAGVRPSGPGEPVI